eukprot:2654307-Karenia_brevis.AAC.1
MGMPLRPRPSTRPGLAPPPTPPGSAAPVTPPGGPLQQTRSGSGRGGRSPSPFLYDSRGRRASSSSYDTSTGLSRAPADSGAQT